MGAGKKLYTMRNQGTPIPAELLRAFGTPPRPNAPDRTGPHPEDVTPEKTPPRQGTLFDLTENARPQPDAPARVRKAAGYVGRAGVKELPTPLPEHRDTPPWADAPERPAVALTAGDLFDELCAALAACSPLSNRLHAAAVKTLAIVGPCRHTFAHPLETRGVKVPAGVEVLVGVCAGKVVGHEPGKVPSWLGWHDRGRRAADCPLPAAVAWVRNLPRVGPHKPPAVRVLPPAPLASLRHPHLRQDDHTPLGRGKRRRGIGGRRK